MKFQATSRSLLAVVVLAGCGGGSAKTYRGMLTPTDKAPNFSLRDQNGRSYTVDGQRGHWSVVTFLYTHCPDVCPLIAANLNGALKSPIGRETRLSVLAVSVDPARDTAAAVRTYVAQHRLLPAFHFLIGTRTQLTQVWREYHVASEPGPNGSVTHSTFEFLIDPEGKERLVYDATITTADLVHDLQELA